MEVFLRHLNSCVFRDFDVDVRDASGNLTSLRDGVLGPKERQAYVDRNRLEAQETLEKHIESLNKAIAPTVTALAPDTEGDGVTVSAAEKILPIEKREKAYVFGAFMSASDQIKDSAGWSAGIGYRARQLPLSVAGAFVLDLQLRFDAVRTSTTLENTNTHRITFNPIAYELPLWPTSGGSDRPPLFKLGLFGVTEERLRKVNRSDASEIKKDSTGFVYSAGLDVGLAAEDRLRLEFAYTIRLDEFLSNKLSDDVSLGIRYNFAGPPNILFVK